MPWSTTPHDFWHGTGLMHWIKNTLLVKGTISPEDLDIIDLVDDPVDVVRIITEAQA